MSFTAGSSGGKYNQALKVDELPPHKHSIYRESDNSLVAFWNSNVGSGNGWAVPALGANGSWKLVTDSIGGSKAHNNVQPNFTVYFWRRTA